MVPIADRDLQNWFSYHKPEGDQQERYEAIRDAALIFARVILNNTPSCADQTATFRKLREVVMSANATIACNE